MEKIKNLASICISPIVFDTVVNGDLPTLKTLLQDFHLSPSERYLGCTPLHHASAKGDLKAVKILIRFGADIDALELGDTSSLDVAIHNNRTSIVKYLASQSNYLIIHADYKGSIFDAIIHGNFETYSFLKGAGVDLKNAGDKECSALAMSLVVENKKITNDLLISLDQLDVDRELILFEEIIKTKKLSPHRRKLSERELESAAKVLKKLKSFKYGL